MSQIYNKIKEAVIAKGIDNLSRDEKQELFNLGANQFIDIFLQQQIRNRKKLESFRRADGSYNLTVENRKLLLKNL